MKSIVKRSKKSNSQLWGKWQRIPSYLEKQNLLKVYLPTFIFVSWLGTYLDLILVNSQLYTFPIRPFADIFPFNILFAVFVLPIFTVITIHLIYSMSTLHKILIILILAFSMTFVEIISEKIGLFVHSNEWRHYYTFIGYIFFMVLVLRFHRFVNGLHKHSAK